MWASRCSAYSCCRAQALRCTGFSSCGTWALLPWGMWNLPGAGIKAMSPALAGDSQPVDHQESLIVLNLRVNHSYLLKILHKSKCGGLYRPFDGLKLSTLGLHDSNRNSRVFILNCLILVVLFASEAFRAFSLLWILVCFCLLLPVRINISKVYFPNSLHIHWYWVVQMCAVIANVDHWHHVLVTCIYF